ncbi:MAG: response regulator [Deltaproteobacteria bacterium]|nr:response regulator [Deltaproteobacteria bacterium]
MGTLAGGIAHDFNNILTTITGYTELALEENRAGRASPEELEQVMKAAERARDLVRRILAFSRKAEADFKPLDINRTVNQVAAMLKRTIPRMIRIDVHLENQPALIHGDAGQIEQVLLNLASNAKDAMPEGGRLVFEVERVTMDETDCRLHPGAPSGEYVQLMVSDTGHGMDKETLEHMYDPFYTTKEVGKGTGMGLAMVYGIVKNHGGYIGCYSEPNQGTSFKIYLPKLKKQNYPAPDEDQPVQESAKGEETILIVDDEPALRDIAARILIRNGYQVFQAESGEAALELYQESPRRFDLVVLDIGMPGMGGLRCLERLRQIDPNSRVIIASGYSKNGPVSKSAGSRAAGYVSKPFTKAELLRAVRQVLDVE